MLAAVSALAAPVTYSTSGVFASTGTNVATFGNVTLTFVGITTDTADPQAPLFFSNASFGYFDASGGSFNSLQPVSDTFTLTITQSAPTAGSGNLAGVLSGSMDANTSSVNFDVTSAGPVVIGATRYSFANTSYALVPPATNNGETTLQGVVDQSEIPEPTSMSLLGLGFGGLALLKRRFSR